MRWPVTIVSRACCPVTNVTGISLRASRVRGRTTTGVRGPASEERCSCPMHLTLDWKLVLE